MYRLLIVDNEEYVVNGLVELFQQEKQLDLEVAGAYSAAEALHQLMTTRMDIVITDIRMPGMNGFELQKIIVSRWPRCKVVFLSGYDDFNYAQEALRAGSVNYILKTEDDQVIIDAVKEAIHRLESERETEKVLIEAKSQLKQALTGLQREFFEGLLLGDKHILRSLEKQFDELHIPLAPNRPVGVVVGKVDEWPAEHSHYDRSLLLYAVQNIANEYLSLSTVHASFVYERSKLVWLIQTKAEPWMERFLDDASKQMASQFVYGTFECIQSSCSDLLHLPLSFAIGKHPKPWETLGGEADRLFASIQSSVRRQMLFMQREEADAAGTGSAYSLQHEAFKQYELLSYSLEHNNREEFGRILESLLEAGDKAARSGNDIVRQQIAGAVLSVLCGYLDKLPADEVDGSIAEIKRGYETGRPEAWETQRAHARALADYILGRHVQAEESEENRIITSIHAYLNANLGGDLSLKTMALALGHNPSYLSRLYKQKAGKGLSETVMELKLARAKALLAQPNYRIQDISKAVGFLSDHYFYRFFKRATRLTPQEYREQVNERQRRE
ncbi:response regulator [Paenibacillus antri]|uniref:Response regulator n=1 Tax=Paenibacillus antri TaxID=2582848 RepID=A0A5R9G958_9BACL|nr:response regulator [Paenibacillus antri]TLS50906.1 response regulator [Paenibacillus antri]